MIEITNLQYNPILRGLLVDYCYRMYEEDAIIDDEHLYMEYIYLKNNNKLVELFKEEHLSNYLNDEYATR